MEFSSVINDILKGKEAEKQKPTAYDTTAEVLRIDGDTAWVHMAGGIDETPVKLTIDAKPGDTVQVRVGGGRAWLTGNFTAPPTDDTSALEAKILAKIADDQAKTVVKRADDGEFDGEDGFSPEATVTKVGDTTTITITDKDGTTTEEIKDGDKIETFVESGSVATFEAVEYPALELVADIIPIQPNDYDSVWFGGGGKNVCIPFEGTKYGIVRTVNDDGTVSITGTATATSWAYLEEYYDLPYCGIDVGDTISIYSDVYLVVMAYNGTTSLGSKSSKDGVATTYTIPANTTRIRILQYPKSTTPASGETFDTTARYWVSKSAFSSWEPYENICPIYGHDHCDVVVSPTLLDTDGTTYTTNFPQIVYGGTLDVVEGTLTVTYALMTFDGTQTFTDRISAQNRVYLQLGGMASQSGLNDDMVLCNALPKATGVQNADHPCIAVGVNNAYVYIQGVTHISGVTNLATLNTWLSNNPITFTYKLATPIVYSVSPKEIELLNGTNNVWANTGDIEIKYAIITEATLETLGDARKTATKYVTDMGDDGIIVHPENDTSNYAKINADGMDVVKGGNSVAYYGDNARIGKENGARALISEGGIDLITEEGALAFSVESGTVSRTIQFVSSFSETYTPTTTDQSITFDELDDAVSDTNVYIGFNIDNGDGSGSYYSRIFTKDGTSQNWTENHIHGEYDGVKTFQYRKDNTYPDLTISNIKLRYYKNVLVPNNQFYGDIIIDDKILHNADWYTEAKTVLWTNPNPGDNFSAQTVSLYNSSTGISAYDCDEVEIYYINTASDARWSSVKVPVDKVYQTSETILAQGASAQNRVYSRRATLTVLKLGMDTMEFKQGYYQTTAGAGYCIPQQIIGIKHI